MPWSALTLELDVDAPPRTVRGQGSGRTVWLFRRLQLTHHRPGTTTCVPVINCTLKRSPRFILLRLVVFGRHRP
ncbi:hypothetical protein ACIQZB_19920 [Streptomyces sp. NPDC097727]|uniref:hypothetical protein n=1 Tax=Streptomyces sp. NPDC097727 TaxID=3366092 RepID=UPI003805DD27